MGFIKSLDEIIAKRHASSNFYDAEMLTVFWETKPDVVARLLPPPLEPAAYPLAIAFVANYPKTNFDMSYQESALFIRAVYKGQEGQYCLAMPVTNDMAMAAGREVFGFPKKMAEIHMTRKGEAVEGWTERRGVRFMEIRAKLTGRFNEPEARSIIMKPSFEGAATKAFTYNVKNFPAPERTGFDYSPRLVLQETLLRPKKMEIGEAEVILQFSDYDPWSEVVIVKVLGTIYTIGDNSMLGGKTVDELNPGEFIPYAFLKWDMK
jgi:acetoacetate decarboxylase